MFRMLFRVPSSHRRALGRFVPLSLVFIALLGRAPSASALSIDLIVPTFGSVGTLGSGNTIDDYWGWIAVTDGTLTSQEINAAQIEISITDPSIEATSNGLSVSNQLGSVSPGVVVGRQRTGIEDNQVFFDHLMSGESLVLPAMNWWVELDWPGSRIDQVEVVTTSIEIAGLQATFQTTIEFTTLGGGLQFGSAQRIAMSPVPEPSTAMLFGVGLCMAAAARRQRGSARASR